MKFEIQGEPSKKKFILESLMPEFIHSLNLEKCSKMILVNLEENSSNTGSTVFIPQINLFFVSLNLKKSLMEVCLTLSHEMIHVKQLAKGILKNVDDGSYIWSSKPYPNDTPYLDRPWELDAFAKQEIMLRRAFDKII